MFLSTLHHLVAWLATHPAYGYLIAFLVAFAESLPIVGTIIPGSITMTAVGTLIGSGILPPWVTIFSATIGALVGDSVGFFLGTHYKQRIEKIWPFKKYIRLLGKGKKFVKKHGGKSIIIGRFFGPVRSAVPLIAGLLHLKTWRFFMAAIPSALLWALVYFTPGILLGALSVSIPPTKTIKFLVIGFLIIVLLWLLFWAIQRSFSWICQSLNRLTDTCWQWLQKHHSTKWIIRFATNQEHPSDHHQLTLLFWGILLFLLFIILSLLVFKHSAVTDLNQPVFYLLQSLHTKGFTLFFACFTLLANKTTMLILAILSSAFCFFYLKEKRAAGHILLATLFIVVLAGGMKTLFFYPRPTGIMWVKASSSFPSGHITFAVALLGFLAYLLSTQLTKEKRWRIQLPATLIILCTLLSRLYLGAHWLTDALGSCLLGSAILLMSIAHYKRKTSRFPSQKPIALIGFIVITILSCLINIKHFEPIIQHAKPRIAQQHTTLSAWWSSPTSLLPHYRLNRVGKKALAFNVQWAGSLQHIHQLLTTQGFHARLPNTLRYNLLRFTLSDPRYHLPFFTHFYLHQKPSLVAIKQLKDKTLLVLTLWPSHLVFNDSARPLWLGTIYYRLPWSNLLTYHAAMKLKYNGTPATFYLKELAPSAYRHLNTGAILIR